jgi:indolepyruvate ferredoxin oxidoreductase
MNLGMNVRAEALEMEQSLYTRGWKWPSATPARTSSTTWCSRTRRLAGHHDRRQDLQRFASQAFLEMGLDDAALRRYGIRILKMGMLFPMEPTIVREFAKA